MSDVQEQNKMDVTVQLTSVNLPIFVQLFCPIQPSNGLDDALLHLHPVRVIFFTQCTNSNANLFQKHFH